MTQKLTLAGYQQTKTKLSGIEDRLTRLAERTDSRPLHRAEAKRSYEQMRAQYLRELKLYEAEHPEVVDEHATR